MSNLKMSQAEAERLLQMLKRSLAKQVDFPVKGEKEEFRVIGDSKRDDFTINIYRGKINNSKYNIGARITKQGILLLELHTNPTNIHTNPDGEKIVGTHWHIYTEDHGRAYAVAAEDINSENFIDTTMRFLDEFNVIEKPSVNYQLELV